MFLYLINKFKNNTSRVHIIIVIRGTRVIQYYGCRYIITIRITNILLYNEIFVQNCRRVGGREKSDHQTEDEKQKTLAFELLFIWFGLDNNNNNDNN